MRTWQIPTVAVTLLLAATAPSAQDSPVAQAQPAPPQTAAPAGPATNASAQAATTPAAPLVRIDATAFDRAGRPVLDLKAADFELRVDGVLQPFDLEVPPTAPAPRTAQVATRRRTPAVDQGPQEVRAPAGRLLAFFLDEYHVAPANTERVREGLRQFIAGELRPDDEVVLFKPLDSIRSIRFTRDRTALDGAAASFAGRQRDYTARTPFEQNYMSRAPQVADGERAQVVTAGLRALAAQLGPLPAGRKSIVLISEGFIPGTPGPRDLVPIGVPSVVNTANRVGVTVYTIDPGATPDSLETGSGTDVLMLLAQQTGGTSVRAPGDLSLTLGEIARDIDAYDLLTLRAPQAADGKFHSLQVTVKRRDTHVRTRTGYWAPSAMELTGSLSAANGSSPLPAPVRRVHQSPYIRPWFGMTRGTEGLTRMTVTWEPEARRGTRLRAEAITLKATTDDGRVLFDGPLSPVRAVGADIGGTSSRAVFDVPPGRVALEMAITADSGKPLDADVRSVHVPDLQTPAVVIATPALYRTRTAREFATVSGDSAATPVTSRTFSRTERLLIRVPVYAADGSTPTLTARLLNQGGQLIRPLLPAAAATMDGLSQFDLALAPLAPGEYRVELTATAQGRQAREVIAFRVIS